MEKHITLVAALNIGFGFLGVFIAIFLFIAVVGGGFLSGDQEAMRITLIVGTALAFFFLVTSIPEIIGGFGLLKHKSWARTLVIIIACVDLIFIPIGTALGIYALWVLLNEETTQLFSEKSKA
jgi:hypothetical protein